MSVSGTSTATLQQVVHRFFKKAPAKPPPESNIGQKRHRPWERGNHEVPSGSPGNALVVKPISGTSEAPLELDSSSSSSRSSTPTERVLDTSESFASSTEQAKPSSVPKELSGVKSLIPGNSVILATNDEPLLVMCSPQNPSFVKKGGQALSRSKGQYGGKMPAAAASRKSLAKGRPSDRKLVNASRKKAAAFVKVSDSDNDSDPKPPVKPAEDDKATSLAVHPSKQQDETYPQLSSIQQHPTRDLFYLLTFTPARIGHYIDLEQRDDSAWCFASPAKPSKQPPSSLSTTTTTSDDDEEGVVERSDFMITHPHPIPGALSLQELEDIASIPAQGTLQYYIYQQRLGHKKLSTSMSPLDEWDSSLLTFHRWIQCRIAAGWIRTSIRKLHDNLQTAYRKTAKLLPTTWRAQNDPALLNQLLRLRHRMAGLWCIYAHVIVELGLEAYREQEQARKKLMEDDCWKEQYINPRKRTRHQKSRMSLTLDGDDNKNSSELELTDLLNHATTILLAAQNCPFVGNHKYIALALGRLHFTGRGLIDGGGWNHVLRNGHVVTTMHSSKELRSVIDDAIKNCWDVMDTCHGTLDAPKRSKNLSQETMTAKSIAFFSQYEPSDRDSKLLSFHRVPKEDRVSHIAMEEDLNAMLDLPNWLQTSLKLTTTVVCDRNGARAICEEVNRWSRLKETLEHRQTTVLVPRYEDRRDATVTPWLDNLVLFRSMDCCSDVPPPTAKWHDVEHVAVSGDDEGRVEWQW